MICLDNYVCTTKEPRKWVAGLLFEDKCTLESGGWLNDRLINAGQVLIKKQFSHVSGFQDVCLGKTLTFAVEHKAFVQVLHTGGDHWVTVSTIGCKPGEICLYDSLARKPSKDLEAQIAALLCTKERSITIRYIQSLSHMYVAFTVCVCLQVYGYSEADGRS